MKKFIPMTAVAVIALMFTSCKKEYTCTCTSNVGGTTTTASGKTEKMSKKDAKAKCEAGSSSTTVAGTTISVTCKLD